MANRKRNIQMKFYVTEDEKRLIDEKMSQLPTRRYGAYLRKMAIDGYIIYTDTAGIKAFTKELSAIGGTSTRSPSGSTPEVLRIRPTWTRYGKGWTRYGSYKDTSYQINAESSH